MKMTNLAQQTLAGIVTHDHRTAAVLEKYQLDFCCKGKRTLAEACVEKGLSAAEITAELQSAYRADSCHVTPFARMTADQLIDYVVTRHHAYVKQAMPVIYGHLEKVVAKHGDRFPEMVAVLSLFGQLQKDMNLHMQKEEIVLFPAIKRAELAFGNPDRVANEAAIISRAVNAMESDHDTAGEILQCIHELTHNYEEPAGACTTFRLSLGELKAFEEDLHRHVHLENNVLFPMAFGFINSGE
jgi:regulator of cell morphogenesis and NO signaling